MVAYFRKMNNLLMAGGAAAGLLFAIIFYRGNIITGTTDVVRVFYTALAVIIGILIGRIAAARLAVKKLRDLHAILYRDTKPQEFIDRFTPVLEQAPHHLAEYMDGAVKLAFAEEALGRFDEGLSRLSSLRTEEMKLHTLGANALIRNQKGRLDLFSRRFEDLEADLSSLREYAALSEKRSPTLSKNLKECIRLLEAGCRALQGTAEAEDLKYLEEECSLSSNLIHKKEMQLLLAEQYCASGQKDKALPLLDEIAESSFGLWSEKRAEELRRVN